MSFASPSVPFYREVRLHANDEIKRRAVASTTLEADFFPIVDSPWLTEDSTRAARIGR